jgi:hypothetical protein
METAKLKKFAQFARRSLLEQVSAKLKLVLAENSAARRESTEAIKKLEEVIKGHGKEQVIERVAYIWFNRFCALRFMDVNRYTRIGVVSPAEGQFQPEVLAEAKMGHIDEEMVPDKVRQQIFALLDGKAPSRDPQGEAYRLLVVAACNYWNKAMPFLFQRIDDYTELLMPDDLLSGNSILAYTREAMTPDACEDVEVIGWLYQFYISEKKDEVFDGLKKNKKITPENIPAATQLFTPHWIVRYLVENSLGRLWLLNRPGSKLVEKMDYYIKPEQAETDFLRISKPEEIKICDPACGSGHMLTYAFDLLYAIYEEEGYEPAEIPEKILTNNLYGIEIDERAGELAAFALTMKARSRSRRFFRKAVKPNICVLEKVTFGDGELAAVGSEKWVVGSEKQQALHHDLHLFEEADNFGSLLRPQLPLEDIEALQNTIHSTLSTSHSLFDSMTHQKVLQALRQADYLSPKYHVVIANPPYMGGRNMNAKLIDWIKSEYPDGKGDLFSAFIVRIHGLSKPNAQIGIMSPNVWLYISSHERLRSFVLTYMSFNCLVELSPTAFKGAAVQICAFNLTNSRSRERLATFIRLVEFGGGDQEMAELTKNAINSAVDYRFHARESDYDQIPGQPIAYWIGNSTRVAFEAAWKLGEIALPRQGMATTNNDRFLRKWYEVEQSRMFLGCQSREEAKESGMKWFPYNKGGGYRKWFGNADTLVNFQNDGKEICDYIDNTPGAKVGSNGRVINRDKYFLPSITWSDIGGSSFGVRFSPAGFIFDVAGSSAFPPNDLMSRIGGILNSKAAHHFLTVLNPTMHFQVGNISTLPVNENSLKAATKPVDNAVSVSRKDWNSYETSWDFTSLPLLNPDYHQPTLKATYQKLRAHWREMTLEMQRLEEENNRIFIDAYGLQDELNEKVDLSEITLTCNPHYRYSNDKSEEELEALLLADTMRELVSYAVGCMFGRYALDKPGLILANQGETLADYVRKVASDPWPVASKERENYASEKLQGSDRVAESHGSGAVGLSSNQDLSQGGTVRLDKPGAAGGGIDSIQHSGGSSAPVVSGVQKLSVDSEGFVGGSGNATTDSNAAGLPKSRAVGTNHGSTPGNQQNASSADGKTGHWPLTTSHLSFVPDEDNVIPMLDGDWFTDDIAERFRKFLRVAFGEEHYEENLAFVEKALNFKGKRNYSIHDYFLGEFYTDHVKRYKKRPIYWLFSSPKGSFNALIYMHRYRPDTVSVVLNDYLREFCTKLSAHKSHLEAVSISASASQGEKTKALKEIEKLKKTISELEEYEREVLYPLATEQLEIDLDDGVKVNYPKFGQALKKIAGLEAKED